MYDQRMAANLNDIERAYRRPLLTRIVNAIRPGETERIWRHKDFLRRQHNN